MYDNPNRIKYQVTYDAGNTANEAWHFTGPKGKKGRLYDYGVEGITEAFTTGASLAIGTASDADAYGNELALDSVAIDAGTVSVRSLYDEIADATSFDALMLDRNLPANTKFVMTLVDDAATGIGTFFVVVDWAD
jgi:hypothetical protein